MTDSVLQKVALGVALALLVAVLPLPYAYYMLLRVVVFAAGIFIALQLLERERNIAIALFIAAALFNPIVPLRLSREVWAFLDIGAAILFGFAGWRAKRT